MKHSKNSVNNHLSSQSSPYLLQHADNPVDWYPWGNEAFEKAIDEDKMIFLSIGYSTCHWCHVMAHESFENTEVASILLRDYVAIKVDREERPDIDEVYMNVCQALTGNGGWPLTVIMSADRKPFFAGTYFPTHTYSQRIGLVELLEQISTLWHNERKSLLDQSKALTEHFIADESNQIQMTSNAKIIELAYSQLRQNFEPKYGGFSAQIKFPTPHNLFFLLRYYRYSNNADALKMVEKTLQSMYDGGIFDHIGYGFSRYSTDNKWLVPHFEKMLYDNALLIMAYCEAYTVTKNEIYRDVAQKIIEYIVDKMTSPDGAFYCALDADSEGIEGKYYVFSYDELEKLLSLDELNFLEKYYNVSKQGNFEGKNILNKIGTSKYIPSIENTVIKKLYQYREKRIPPFLDNKILSSWNGLMIGALSFAGRIIDKKYLEYAKSAAEFIFDNMVDDDFNLYTSFKEKHLSDTGFLPDYSNMVWGLLELYTSTLDTKHLERALNLTKKIIAKFWDEDKAKFFMNEKNSAELPMRPKDDYDGAMPSGNSVTITNFIKLYNLTYDDMIKSILDKSIDSFGSTLENSPSAYLHFVSALLLYTKPHRQIIITGKNQRKLYDNLVCKFTPFTTTILYEGDEAQIDIIPKLRNYNIDDDLKAYVCENFSCLNPITNEQELLDEL